MSLEVLSTKSDLKRVVGDLQSSNKTIGVVPTMGALHEGHLSLVKHSVKRSDATIVTIYVNPTQFGAGEDLDRYPKTFDEDVAKLEAEGADFVFAPANDEVYPAGFSAGVLPPAISKRLEGEFRPTHFAGVATVVLKLLNMTEADFAFFGQKDFQQAMVIKQMVADLNVPVEIQICPIVRDEDGLALSSRNTYLDSEQRVVATSLNKTLDHVEQLVVGGLRDGFEVITEMRQMLIDAGVDNIDYAIVADPETLATVDSIDSTVVALIAAYVGETRLIDNRVIAIE